MASNPYPLNPKDKSGETLQNYPAPTPAKFVTNAAPPSVSSVITFGSNTTVIEVTALNASLALKWGSGSVIAVAGATANYDHIIPVNSTRRFAIPINSQGFVGSVMGANPQNGLYSTCAVIATGSVITGITEY